MDHQTTELVFFSGFNTNAAEADAVRSVREVEGCNRAHHGVQVEDSTRGLWVQDWASLAHHEAFQATEDYPAFVSGSANFSKSVDQIYHVTFYPEKAFTAALKAPQTELQIVVLKEGRTYDDLYPGYASGVTLENENVCILAKGCRYPESHQQDRHASLLDSEIAYTDIVADVRVEHYMLSE